MSVSYQYTITDTYSNELDCGKLQNEISESAIAETVLGVSRLGSNFDVTFQNSISAGDQTVLDSIIAAHVHITTAESLEVYLDTSVFPFVKKLMNVFAAENISMGITQAGKTGDVLGLFVKQYDVNSNSLPISLKDTFDTGSLYESIKVITYIRNNPSEFTGMSPYITDARLLEMLNKIETFLGVPLSS